MSTEIHEAMTEQKKRDWVSILGPTLLAVIVSVAIQAGAAAWYFGAMNQRLSSVEERQKAYDTDHVSRKELEQRDASGDIYRQELNIHLNRLDDKLDRILENQSGRSK